MFNFFFLSVLTDCNNFISFYLILEGSTIAILALLLISSKYSPFTEGALKYFCLSTISTMFLLSGIGLVFFYADSFSFIEIKNVVMREKNLSTNPFLNLSIILILGGFAFKLAIFPGQVWAPDVYERLSYSYLLIFACAIKVAVFVPLVKLYFIFRNTIFTDVIAIISILSIIIGVLGALMQTNIKRLLAFSSVNQIGFALLGFLGGLSGLINSLVYLYIYILTLAITIILLDKCSLEPLAISKSSSLKIKYISDLRGFYQSAPTLIWPYAFIFLLLSFAGIPPFLGFFPKYFILTELMNTDYTILCIFALVFSVISCYYYLRLIKVMTFDKKEPTQMFTVKSINDSTPYIEKQHESQKFGLKAIKDRILVPVLKLLSLSKINVFFYLLLPYCTLIFLHSFFSFNFILYFMKF